jgi:hypothetical protein
MNNPVSMNDLYAILQRIEHKLEPLKQTPTWVPASWIMELTGWTCKKLEKARNAGQSVITWRQKKGKDPEYLVQSIDPVFIIKREVKEK